VERTYTFGGENVQKFASDCKKKKKKGRAFRKKEKKAMSSEHGKKKRIKNSIGSSDARLKKRESLYQGGGEVVVCSPRRGKHFCVPAGRGNLHECIAQAGEKRLPRKKTRPPVTKEERPFQQVGAKGGFLEGKKVSFNTAEELTSPWRENPERTL